MVIEIENEQNIVELSIVKITNYDFLNFFIEKFNWEVLNFLVSEYPNNFNFVASISWDFKKRYGKLDVFKLMSDINEKCIEYLEENEPDIITYKIYNPKLHTIYSRFFDIYNKYSCKVKYNRDNYIFTRN